MNERIKVIIAAYGDSDLQWNDSEVEKFAELIVKECGIYADMYIREVKRGNINPLAKTCYEFLNEYFGVK